MQYSTTVLESQADWLTASFHTRDSAARAKSDAERWTRQEQANGAEVKSFCVSNYVGWMAGRVRYGESQKGAIIQLSGQLAEDHIPDMVPRASNVSRLDLAVTVRIEPSRTDVGRAAFNDACDYRAFHPSSARPSLYENGDGGATLYVGDRASNWILRVYNKEAECVENRDTPGAEHYAGCWRYELEVKGKDALRQAQLYHAVDSRPTHVQGYVYQWTVNHGVVPAFPYDGSVKLEPGFRRRSDRDSRLLWLAESVRPAVQWLR